MDDLEKKLKKIRDEVIDCKKCDLYKTRTLPVIGKGSHQSKIVFIGEAPGANEDRTGVPFCGASGNILTEILKSINIERDEVYICNILKCRPPKNRDPLKSEIELCTPYLKMQIEAIQPEVICTLGRFSMDYIMKMVGLEDKLEAISKIHGKVFETNYFSKKVKVVPLYHPAVAVYNANMKTNLKEDIKVLKELIN